MEIQSWRTIALQKQGIDGSHSFGNGAAGVEKVINTLGYIQIDTLNVIERAHHHSLWNRVDHYQPADLDKLLAQRKIFEHWHHALSYLPIEKYRYAIPFMQKMKSGDTPYYKKRDPILMASIVEQIKSDGPLKLRDLKDSTAPKAKKGAWNSRPTKRALEILFFQGDLMVSARDKMERVYDLTENVLPGTVSTTEPTLEEHATYLIETTLQANGFATLKYILHGKSTAALKKQAQDILNLKVKAGEINCYKTDFMPPVYAVKNLFDNISFTPANNVKLLSPFDNALIHRERAKELFDFSYRLECYTPLAKRQYGYFCLPILYGNDLIGRVDCKAHRKEGIFTLLHLHIEKEIIQEEEFFALLAKEIQKFSRFNTCKEVKIEKSSPPKYKKVLKDSLLSVDISELLP